MFTRMTYAICGIAVTVGCALAAEPPQPVPLPRLVTAVSDGKGNLELEYFMHTMKPVTTMPPGLKFPVTAMSTVIFPKKQIVRLVDVVVHDADGKKIDSAEVNRRLKKPTVVVLFGKGSYADLDLKNVLKGGALIVDAPSVELP